MNPKIDTIVMSSDGHHATVSGPIEWEADDTSATFAAAVGQMQGDHIVFAAGQNATVFTPANPRWETQVDTLNGKKLVVAPRRRLGDSRCPRDGRLVRVLSVAGRPPPGD